MAGQLLVIDALKLALASADFAALSPWYGPDTVIEGYAAGRRMTTEGAEATARIWRRLVEGPGEVTYWSVVCAEGGYEIDAQRNLVTPDGVRPLRQLHRLHAETGGKIAWHLVFPARPYQPARLAAPAISRIVRGAVKEMPHSGFSAARLYRATGRAGQPIVIKHLVPGLDWMARATQDPGREALLFTEGVYDTLPPRMRSPVILAEEHDSGWILVMEDVGEQLRAVVERRDRAVLTHLLEAVHDLHMTSPAQPPSRSLCTVADRLRLFSPVRSLIERRGCDTLPKTFLTSWEIFAERVDRDVADAVLQLVADPSRLLAALAAEQDSTLLHGDYRPANVGIEPDGRVVALDWGLACWGPPALDFMWFLSNTAWGDDDEREYLETTWERLTRTTRDSRASDLAVLYHAVMGEVGFLLAETIYQPRGFPRPSAATVPWWLRRIRAALDRLGEIT